MEDKWKSEISYGVNKIPTLDEQLSGRGFKPGELWEGFPSTISALSSANKGMKSQMFVIDSLEAMTNSAQQPKKRSLEDDLEEKPVGKVFTTPIEKILDQRREAYGNTDKKTRSKKKSKKRKKK